MLQRVMQMIPIIHGFTLFFKLVEDSLPSENDGHSDAKRHNKESKAVTAERKEEIRREKVSEFFKQSLQVFPHLFC